jgi:hypothetical protein
MHENIYRRPGSPEVDAAWEALGVDCMFPTLHCFSYFDAILTYYR